MSSYSLYIYIYIYIYIYPRTRPLGPGGFGPTLGPLWLHFCYTLCTLLSSFVHTARKRRFQAFHIPHTSSKIDIILNPINYLSLVSIFLKSNTYMEEHSTAALFFKTCVSGANGVLSRLHCMRTAWRVYGNGIYLSPSYSLSLSLSLFLSHTCKFPCQVAHALYAADTVSHMPIIKTTHTHKVLSFAPSANLRPTIYNRAYAYMYIYIYTYICVYVERDFEICT